MLLHDADQGTVEPEVRRSDAALRPGEGRAADRRQQHQLRGADRGDDHRGAAQHAVRRLGHAERAAVRRDGRGALPRRPIARRGLGRGHHPPARVRGGGVAVGDGVQRRGVRRLAERGARRQRHHRRGAPPRAAVPARHGRQPAVRPVRRPRRVRTGDPTEALVNPQLAQGRPRRLAPDAQPRPPRQRGGYHRRRAAAHWCRAGSTWSSGSTPRDCCPRSCSSSAARAATPPSSSA